MLGKIAVSLVGVILIVFGMYHTRKRRQFIQDGEETIAEVYDYQYHMNKRWSYVYSYTLIGGKKIIAAEPIYYHRRRTRKKPRGTKVEIVYKRDNPTEFMAKKQTRLMTGLYIMILMGIVYVTLGIFVI